VVGYHRVAGFLAFRAARFVALDVSGAVGGTSSIANILERPFE